MKALSTFGLGLMTFALFAYGALSADDERTIICQSGYSASLRMSGAKSQNIKRSLCKIQESIDGTPVSHCMVDNELDHIVPLEIWPPHSPADPNGLDNLQLQPWPTAHTKDKLENEARRAYCAGEIELPEAIARFHRDVP